MIVHMAERYHKIPYYILLTSSSARLIYIHLQKKPALRNNWAHMNNFFLCFTPSQRKEKEDWCVSRNWGLLHHSGQTFFFRTRLPVEMWNASSFFHAQRNIYNRCLVYIYTHYYIIFSWPFFLYLYMNSLFCVWGVCALSRLIDMFQSVLAIAPHHHKERIGHYITFWNW